MSAFSKLAGLVAGVSTVAVLGVAIAQSVPPNPNITNHPIAAGQQSTHRTPMGETGVLGLSDEIRTAVITRQEEIAVVTPAEPAPVAEPVAQAPVEPAQVIAMGAPPAPVEAAAMPMKQDRN